jgi:hypothetical protein
VVRQELTITKNRIIISFIALVMLIFALQQTQ